MAAAAIGIAAVAALGLGAYSKLKASGTLGGCNQPPIQQGPRAIDALYQKFPQYSNLAVYPSDPVPDSVYQSFWNAIVEPPHKANWPGDKFTPVVLASFVARHVVYWRRTQPQYASGQLVSPSDCGGGSFSSGLSGIGEASVGIGLAGEAASVAQTFGKFAGALGSSLKAIPVVGAIADEAIHVITSIFTHHKQAVAKEQETLCALVSQFNSVIDQVAAAVQSGQWKTSQGADELTQVFSSYNQQWRSVIPNSGEAPIIGWAFAGVIETYKWLWAHCYGVPA